MKNKRMIPWAALLILTAGLLAGCDGHRNPTTTQPLPETIPATTAAPIPTETQPPQTEAVTEPVPTEAPTQPTEPEPALMELSRRERFEINNFLSDLSAQWFHEDPLWDEDPANDVFYSDTGSVSEIVEFVWLYAKLNLNEELEVVVHDENDYYGFQLSILSPIAQRFFGRTLDETALQTMESAYYSLHDGMICGPAADGESYMNMTVAEGIYDPGDGTLRVEFAIYDAWEFADVGGTVLDQDLYYLTGEQAQIDPSLQLYLKGAAILQPQTLANGRESYRLVSYELYAPAS